MLRNIQSGDEGHVIYKDPSHHCHLQFGVTFPGLEGAARAMKRKRK